LDDEKDGYSFHTVGRDPVEPTNERREASPAGISPSPFSSVLSKFHRAFLTVKKSRICIIAHNAYGALAGGAQGHIGGAERQTSLMARWFAAAGHETSLITWGTPEQDGQRLAGVTVRTVGGASSGLPIVRFFHPRLSGLYAAMRRADAEVYYHNAAEAITGLAAHWCRRHGRKFVYSAAAELACDVRLPLLTKGYERVLYRYGVRHAHLRIVQTGAQQRLLQQGWGLSSVVLPMPCPGPEDVSVPTPELPSPPRVIWVGRVDENKRLNWFLDVAEKLPSVNFEIAAAANTSVALTRELQQRASLLPNVRWCGAVPREQMPEFYRGAACLCCTSMHEGFPNIFIEAWSHGVPVVTTFDPDGLVTRLNLGGAATDVSGLAREISRLTSDAEGWRACSRRAREYYVAHHRVDAAMERFQTEFDRLLVKEGTGPSSVKMASPEYSSSSTAR
jgi:glycosyltransferase involved in cell wall biosynthesis